MADNAPDKLKEGSPDLPCINSTQRTQFREHIQAVFDANNFHIQINGNCIDYDKQTLTEKGLQISLNSKQSSVQQILIAGNNSLEYDRRYIENKYCIQLASAIDRGSNSAYQKMKNYKRSIFNNREAATPFYSLQICELTMKKIPIKPRCFQTVFKKIPCHKIKVLFENDSFFIQVVKFFSRINFKVDIDAIYLNQNNINKQMLQNLEQQSSFYNENSQSSQQERRCDKRDKGDEAVAKYSKINKKIIMQNLTEFEKKAIRVYEHICTMLKSCRFCYERINLLIGTFHRQNRLSAFLYELNRQQICEQLTKYLPQIYVNSDGQQKAMAMTAKKTKTPQLNPPKLSALSVLNYTIQIIKTINLSLNKSQIAFKVINTYLLTQKHLSLWLNQNINKFIQNNDLNLKFIQLLALISQLSPMFISNFYCVNHCQINHIISRHVKWIYYTIQSVHESQEKQQKLRKTAVNSLDNLMHICKSTIKQTMSAVNIGRVICKQICETATNLREKDIQFLTIVCCVNVFSRQSVMRYLFGYFRKFIKSVKKSLAGPKRLIMNLARKNKHYMIQIMQSIRKISQIDSIDFAIDSQLLSDIQEILKNFSWKHEKLYRTFNTKSWKGDCTLSVYQAMLRNLKIEHSQKKDSQTHDSECQSERK